MFLEAYKAVEWAELLKIHERRNGEVYKTSNTGKHIRYDDGIPDGYTIAPIICVPGEMVEIIPANLSECIP